MSDFSLTLVSHLKTSKIINDMAKVSIKSVKSVVEKRLKQMQSAGMTGCICFVKFVKNM
jgi:hypothetical protein